MKKLYVGNLPFQATEEDVTNWFSEAGVTSSNVTLVRDRFSGQPRGFGFVEVNNDEDAGRAIQALNGHDFLGRNVVVNEARPPSEGGGRGGGAFDVCAGSHIAAGSGGADFDAEDEPNFNRVDGVVASVEAGATRPEGAREGRGGDRDRNRRRRGRGRGPGGGQGGHGHSGGGGRGRR